MEIVCRDRHGLYAEGTKAGAPLARQVADRFHLVQNLPDRFEQHLSGQRQRPVDPIEVRQDEQTGRTSIGSIGCEGCSDCLPVCARSGES